jgi:hypothetical protein
VASASAAFAGYVMVGRQNKTHETADFIFILSIFYSWHVLPRIQSQTNERNQDFFPDFTSEIAYKT